MDGPCTSKKSTNVIETFRRLHAALHRPPSSEAEGYRRFQSPNIRQARRPNFGTEKGTLGKSAWRKVGVSKSHTSVKTPKKFITA